MNRLPITIRIEYWGPTYSRIMLHDSIKWVGDWIDFNSRMICDVAATDIGASIEKMTGRTVRYELHNLGA